MTEWKTMAPENAEHEKVFVGKSSIPATQDFLQVRTWTCRQKHLFKGLGRNEDDQRRLGAAWCGTFETIGAGTRVGVGGVVVLDIPTGVLAVSYPCSVVRLV
ncbi:hypothetical protein Mpal_0673 [Methanosphaerula palustris E1-9c]|uniref:Uncharacterized protein n=1 Tax=Methanosphaerula palustris (strain ATCC BAA-1556 / DSM 19958 / E1-9c) TaxID=521011 RepID=B8GFJ2_METPE|nr:hypothetical protein Mpal_0673 [Methanosphaerula palustris E1-9c]